MIDVTDTKLYAVWIDGKPGYLKFKGDRVFKVEVSE